jgi:hypothetical protein
MHLKILQRTIRRVLEVHVVLQRCPPALYSWVATLKLSGGPPECALHYGVVAPLERPLETGQHAGGPRLPLAMLCGLPMRRLIPEWTSHWISIDVPPWSSSSCLHSGHPDLGGIRLGLLCKGWTGRSGGAAARAAQA